MKVQNESKIKFVKCEKMFGIGSSTVKLNKQIKQPSYVFDREEMNRGKRTIFHGKITLFVSEPLEVNQ